MTDVFISYSTEDSPLAEYWAAMLRNEGLEVFVAGQSVQSGTTWPKEIMKNLRRASWVIFLASESSSKSVWVQQELGAALGDQKNLVPVVWDMPPENLPGWVNQLQALDLRNLSIEDAGNRIAEIAGRIKKDKTTGLVIFGLLVAGLIYILEKKS